VVAVEKNEKNAKKKKISIAALFFIAALKRQWKSNPEIRKSKWKLEMGNGNPQIPTHLNLHNILY